MSSRRIASLSLSLLLLGGITLLAAPTKEEVEVVKYAKVLKSGGSTKEKVTALKELGRLGHISTSLTRNIVPDIVSALDDKDAKVRAEAAHTVGLIDPAKKSEIVAKLVKMLKEEKDESVKQGAAMGLGAMGPDAKDAIMALREAQQNATKNDAKTFQAALMQITGKKK